MFLIPFSHIKHIYGFKIDIYFIYIHIYIYIYIYNIYIYISPHQIKSILSYKTFLIEHECQTLTGCVTVKNILSEESVKLCLLVTFNISS